ncbi:NotI family restriction endonuclease [Candidatus Poriferisodalis sp.]|uniref:NotI family restriction endonuclease n=1 Tax=Candidatus Poriferisodalis sp. TaxID=3101277 RepID=UPI003B0230CC
MTRYGIAEWYGHDLLDLTTTERRDHADAAVNRRERPCPYRPGPCNKTGGVCSMRQYDEHRGRITSAAGRTVIMCPSRFEQDHLLLEWLNEIVGFGADAMLAREVPFMVGNTGKPAGKIDLVVATEQHDLRWFGLEIQAVYFSGPGMDDEFVRYLRDEGTEPLYPNGVRRPDWRSSSAKRLAPQLQVKVPTLRRWGSKIAVAVDRPFFDSIGGPSAAPSHDLDAGDVIWLVPEVVDGQLARRHWEVLTLEASCEKLLAATPIPRADFEQQLRERLRPFSAGA